MRRRDKDPTNRQPVRADGLLQGSCRDESLVYGERDDVKGLQAHRGVDLRIRHERHLDFARDRAKSGDPEMHLSRREAAFFDAPLNCNAHGHNIEDHTINDCSWGKGDLTKTQELRSSTSRSSHFGHADRATADLDTHASRNHQRAPDTENETTVLRTSRDMLAVDLQADRYSKLPLDKRRLSGEGATFMRTFISAFLGRYLSLPDTGAR